MILSTGMKDGQLCVHDMRTQQIVSKARVHQGAINFLDTSLSGFVVTGAADKSVKTFDIMNSFQPIQSLKTTDAVFCG